MFINHSLFFGVFLTITSLLLLCVLSLDRARATRRRRLARFALSGLVSAGEVAIPAKSKSRTRGRREGTVLERLTYLLDRSGLKTSLTELIALCSLASITILAGGLLLLKMSILSAALLAVILPPATLLLAVHSSRARRERLFAEELPNALDMFARGLRTGRPVVESMDIVVKNSDGPVREEFATCRDELHFGMDLAGTLNALSKRMPTPEVKFFAVSTALQTETGGNLIETMENLAQQLRQRKQLRSKIKALSAESKASAAILSGLPFGVAGLIMIINRAYLMPLFIDPRGQVMLALGIGSILLGIMVMRKMGKIGV